MCFSLDASFMASAILLPIGLYSCKLAIDLRQQYPKQNYLPFALIPLFFALQQALEGMVWWGLLHRHQELTIKFSSLYLFFAYWWWPAYSNVAIYYLEPNPQKKKLILFTLALGLNYGLLLYVPTIMTSLHTSPIIINQHLCYQNLVPLTNYLPWPKIRLIYFITTILPFLITEDNNIKLLGLFVLIASYLTLEIAAINYTSLWCFWSALLSGYIILILLKARAIKTLC